MKNKINSRGIQRRDNIELEDEQFALYCNDLFACMPVNNEENAQKMRDVLRHHLGINVVKVADGFAVY